MNMRRARRLHPSGESFRTWVREVWKKFGEISGDRDPVGKLAGILGVARNVPKAKTKGK
jgi:hypothetical protein